MVEQVVFSSALVNEIQAQQGALSQPAIEVLS